MRKYTLLIAALFLAALSAPAQNAFRGAYFMDTYLYGHTMNPALTANRGYASLALGHIDLQTQSNMGVSTFLYPTGSGSVNSFLSESVSAEQFLGKLRKNNIENANVQLDVLNFGFWTKKDQFHSFSLSAHVIENASVPYDLFRFLKTGSSDGNEYSLAGFGERARAYAQMAYGISFPVTDQLRIGGKVKALVGLAYEDVRFDRIDVTLSGERWAVQTDGRMMASNLPVTKSSGSVGVRDLLDVEQLEDIDWSQFRPSGFGAAIDLGTTWDVLPWLQLSASITGLGFIHWKMDANRTTQGSWTYTGFDNISFEGNDNLQAQLDAKFEELNELLRFSPSSGGKAPADFLPATFYLGAKAKPCDWFSAGLLGTARREGQYSWAEVRGALNVEPTHWFGISGSAAYGTFGPKFSGLMNLRLGPFALFLAGELSSPYFVSTEPRAQHKLKDYFLGDVTALPRDNLNVNLMIGLNLVFGRKVGVRVPVVEVEPLE